MKIIRFKKRKAVLMFWILLLLVNSLLITAYHPVSKNSPNPFICSLPFQQEAIIEDSDRFQPKFLEPVLAFLFSQPYTENFNLKVIIERFFTNYINFLIIIIFMFYIYYRLSRTDIDEFIFNMVIV